MLARSVQQAVVTMRRMDGTSLKMPSGSSLALPTVLLWHALPNGTGHIDWLIARHADQGDLVSFRLAQPLHDLPSGECVAATHIGDHRRRYLDYQGPISGNRGHVTQLTRGRVVSCECSDTLAMHVQWPGRMQHVSLVEHAPGCWEISVQ